MIYKVSDFTKKFRVLIGDGSIDIPEDFIIEGLNWAFRELPMVPKLGKLFSKHYQFNLDAQGHYKWLLNSDFRRIIDFPVFNFYTSTGGEPCKLNVCYQDNDDFYNKNGLVSLKEAGKPCEYTLEQEDDGIYLVLDRPSDVPIILDYIACGVPMPVTSSDDTIEISAIAENLILSVMRVIFYEEADDFAFAGSIMDYLDNKTVVEAIQMLNRRWSAAPQAILGES